MSHLAHDLLWSLSRNELPEPERRAAQLHLDGCPDCRVALDDVKLAQGVLMDLPPVPAMPDAMARRVGQQLAEAADARAARQFTSWWQSLFTPRFVLGAAMAVALVITGAYLLATPTPAPIALPSPTPTTPSPVPAPMAEKKKLSVTIASAKKSTATRKQVLSEGATVSTQVGGSVWMQLPDGSRAGLTGASEVTLATLDSKQLTLEVTKGSLAMVVPHREDRVLTVRAGDLEVKDLGTRFLVSREPSHTIVAVEEGVVEVKTPTGTRQVRAGHAVSWSQGQLSDLDWERSPPPVQAALPSTPVDANPQAPDSVARLAEEDDDSPPPVDETPAPTPGQAELLPPDQTPTAADEQWEGLPPKPAPQQKLPPVSAFAPPRTVVTSSERAFSLRNIERKLRELGTTITSPSAREARARNISLAADAGDCEHALRLADAWLSEPLTNASTEQAMRRNVQLQQVRCLNHLGRTQDANALQRILETAH